MQKIVVKKVDVFTTKPFHGNPAGVITDADGLATEDMQKIASVLNHAECVYVETLDASNSVFRARFFTQTHEIKLSTHALIAACFAVIEEGRIPLNNGITAVQFDTKAGILPVEIHFDSHAEASSGSAQTDSVPVTGADGRTGMLRGIMIHQKREEILRSNIPVYDLAGILGIDEQEIRGTGLPMEVFTIGLNQLIIPIMKQDTLINLHPDLIKLSILNRDYDIQSNEIFTLESINPDSSVYTRSFSPAVGLWEDVASGSGTGSIAAYLVRHGLLNAGNIIIESGSYRDYPPRVFIEIDEPEGSVISLRVGGLAVTSIVQSINIDAGTVTVV